MKRIAGTDAVFLSGETPTWHQHIGGITLLDPADAPDFTFERVRDMLIERLPFSPKFTYKVERAPLGLDNSVWVDDPDFDVNRHIIRAACPRPGSMQALSDMVGRIMSKQLDRRRPLWETWFVEGLEGDRVALIMKFHHSLQDGMSGASLMDKLFDLEPNPATTPDIPTLIKAGPAPTEMQWVIKQITNPIQTPLRMARFVANQAIRSVGVLPVMFGDDKASSPMDAPKTPWNASLSANRAVSFGSVPLEDVKTIKNHYGVKVNDVMLAICGGMLRRHLESMDALPENPLIAAMPISTRAEGDTELTNKISSGFVSLATHLDDPAERIAEISRSTGAAKNMQKALRAREVQSIGEVAPPLLVYLASRTMWSTQLDTRIPAAANCSISNVPGPPFPLYMAGAKIDGIFPMAGVMMGMGMSITLVSYQGNVDIGLHVDSELVPNPWLITDHLDAAAKELLDSVT